MNCPVCGSRGYAGLVGFSCDKQGCQNHKKPSYVSLCPEPGPPEYYTYTFAKPSPPVRDMGFDGKGSAASRTGECRFILNPSDGVSKEFYLSDWQAPMGRAGYEYTYPGGEISSISYAFWDKEIRPLFSPLEYKLGMTIGRNRGLGEQLYTACMRAHRFIVASGYDIKEGAYLTAPADAFVLDMLEKTRNRK